MTSADIALITGSAGITALVTGFFAWLTNRNASAASASSKAREGESSVQIAAIGTFRELVVAYQTDQEKLRGEMHDLRTEFHRREAELEKRIDDLIEQNRILRRNYDSSIALVERLTEHIRRTDPTWPEHGLPKFL